MGLTHTMLLSYLATVKRAMQVANRDGNKLTAAGLSHVINVAEGNWRTLMVRWQTTLQAARWEGGAIGVASFCKMYLYAFAREDLEEAASVPAELTEQGQPPFAMRPGATPYAGAMPFMQRLDAVLEAMEQRLYSDGFKLSARIWKLDQQSLAGIRETLREGVAQGKSIWEIAQALETFLGANQDCPRWTQQRMAMTSPERAASDAGLLRGDACSGGAGVAYNALRLAVNEVQAAHQGAIREFLGGCPWVTGERLYLNDLRGDTIWDCECEHICGYPPNRVSAVLPQGSVLLPLHPWCMCYILPEFMSKEELRKRIDAWLRGEPWPELDEWLARWGIPRTVPLPPFPPEDFPPGIPKWWWWLLLLLLAEAYRRWSEGTEDEQNEALEFEPGDW